MDEQARVDVAQPRFEHGHFLLIAGIGGQFTQQTVNDIPELWERFIPYIGKIPGQKKRSDLRRLLQFRRQGWL